MKYIETAIFIVGGLLISFTLIKTSNITSNDLMSVGYKIIQGFWILGILYSLIKDSLFDDETGRLRICALFFYTFWLLCALIGIVIMCIDNNILNSNLNVVRICGNIILFVSGLPLWITCVIPDFFANLKNKTTTKDRQ